MPTGYSYHPFVRITPEDGSVSVLDLRNEFSDTSGPSRHRIRNKLEDDGYEDVNRASRQIFYGFRVEVRMYFTIINTDDHAALAKIVTALVRQRQFVELSLDGGHTYRKIIMTRAPSPRPHGGKTLAGAEHQLRVETVELFDQFPVMTGNGGW